MSKLATTSYPRPELFWDDNDDGEPEPMKAPIATIHVWRLGTQSEREQIDVTTLDALPNRNAFRDAYGPGLFEVSGRSSQGAIVAKATFRIALRPGQQWHPPQADAPTLVDGAPAPMPSSGGVPDALSMLVHELKGRGADPTMTLLLTHVLSMSKEMATQSRAASTEIVQAITQLAGARIQDQIGLTDALLRMKQAASGGGASADTAKFFKEGMAYMQNLIDQGAQAEADGGAGETKLEDLMKSFLDAINARRGDNVINMPNPGQRASGS